MNSEQVQTLLSENPYISDDDRAGDDWPAFVELVRLSDGPFAMLGLVVETLSERTTQIVVAIAYQSFEAGTYQS